MRYLSIHEVDDLHTKAIKGWGGSDGIRDIGALQSAVAQPAMAFGGNDLYPTLVEKAAAIGFSLVMNHPYIDGNKRVGYLAMKMMPRFNGHNIRATVDAAEKMVLAVAAGEASREQMLEWLREHVVPTE